ncbi:MAG: TerC family protein [Dehalococcoidales bacterium]|jgi:tellurite resistance protein TerC
MSHETILWIAFAIIVPVALGLDLGVFQRQAHKVKVKEALLWSAVWISLALLFGLSIYLMLGSEKALNFFTGYLVEESLSVDNLFVFLLIFTYFSVPEQHQHRVLFWGIVGAIVMRGIFIATGITLLDNLHWVIYIFGAFLIFTGIKLVTQKDRELKPEKNPVLRLFRKFMPITKRFHGSRFFVKGKRYLLATPLLLVLIVIETTDIIFAVDSVPAVLAITRDPFIVYTSNIFAILGLRAIYFALAGVILRLRFLNYGLAVILVFLGVKMVVSADFFHVEISQIVSLGVVIGILAISAIASVLIPEKNGKTDDSAKE